ncbi:MAG TPA: hypothetical protein VMU78_02445 [Methylocella sp.]|nr:hypothetical protein [Methylocella sp.]
MYEWKPILGTGKKFSFIPRGEAAQRFYTVFYAGASGDVTLAGACSW